MRSPNVFFCMLVLSIYTSDSEEWDRGDNNVSLSKNLYTRDKAPKAGNSGSRLPQEWRRILPGDKALTKNQGMFQLLFGYQGKTFTILLEIICDLFKHLKSPFLDRTWRGEMVWWEKYGGTIPSPSNRRQIWALQGSGAGGEHLFSPTVWEFGQCVFSPMSFLKYNPWHSTLVKVYQFM